MKFHETVVAQLQNAHSFYSMSRFFLKSIEVLNKQKDIEEKQLFNFKNAAQVYVKSFQ